jgi:hypothetical protein
MSVIPSVCALLGQPRGHQSVSQGVPRSINDPSMCIMLGQPRGPLSASQEAPRVQPGHQESYPPQRAVADRSDLGHGPGTASGPEMCREIILQGMAGPTGNTASIMTADGQGAQVSSIYALRRTLSWQQKRGLSNGHHCSLNVQLLRPATVVCMFICLQW